MNNHCASEAVNVPRAAVSMVVFREQKFLLVQRGQAPNAGLWSLPGGRIGLGERAVDAVKRELREETAVEAEIAGTCGVKDAVQQNDRGDVLSHFVITVFYGFWRQGQLQSGGDVLDARWCCFEEIHELAITEGLTGIVSNAARLAGTGRFTHVFSPNETQLNPLAIP